MASPRSACNVVPCSAQTATDLGAEIGAHGLLALPGLRAGGGRRRRLVGAVADRASLLHPLLLHRAKFAHAAPRFLFIRERVDTFTCPLVHAHSAATSSAALPSGSSSIAVFPCAVL